MQYQDWEKSNYEVYSSLQHGQDDELMHFGVKGMSWKKGAEYLRNGGKLVNGVVVYAGNQLQKSASALDKATGGRAGRAATVAKGKTALKAALKATGKAIDKGAYHTGKAMAKAVNSKALAKTAAKVKAKISTNKYGKKVADIADAVAKKVNSKGAKQFRKNLAYKLNNTYRNEVDTNEAKKQAAIKASADLAKARAQAAKDAEAKKKSDEAKAAAAKAKADADAKRESDFESQVSKAYGNPNVPYDKPISKAFMDKVKDASRNPDGSYDVRKAGDYIKEHRYADAKDDYVKNMWNDNDSMRQAIYKVAESYGAQMNPVAAQQLMSKAYDESTGKIDQKKLEAEIKWASQANRLPKINKK